MNKSYKIQIAGHYLIGGWRLGLRLFGGEIGGSFAKTFDLKTAKPTGEELPLHVNAQHASAILIRRMAAPQPPLLTTFNQIGFDSYNYLLGTVAIDEEAHRFIMLAVEGTPGLTPTINTQTKSIFPLNGSFIDSYFDLTGEGFTIDVSGVGIAMRLFRVSGLLQPDLRTDSLDVYAEVNCGEIEFFGFALNLLGMCNPSSGKLIVNGDAQIAPLAGNEGVRPAGVTVQPVDYMPNGGWYDGGYLQAVFGGTEMTADEQLPILLAIDDATGLALDLNYGTSLEKLVADTGVLLGVRLHLPPDFDPDGKHVVVLVNLYPLISQPLMVD